MPTQEREAEAIERVKTFLKNVKSIVRVTPQLVSRANTILKDTLEAGVSPKDPTVVALKEWISDHTPNTP